MLPTKLWNGAACRQYSAVGNSPESQWPHQIGHTPRPSGAAPSHSALRIPSSEFTGFPAVFQRFPAPRQRFLEDSRRFQRFRAPRSVPILDPRKSSNLSRLSRIPYSFTTRTRVPDTTLGFASRLNTSAPAIVHLRSSILDARTSALRIHVHHPHPSVVICLTSFIFLKDVHLFQRWEIEKIEKTREMFHLSQESHVSQQLPQRWSFRDQLQHFAAR
jgi:hypothetical protein